MKWPSFLSKPALESADPVKRAQAVANNANPDLIAKLTTLARHDEDAEVRKAAVRKIEDLSLLADRAQLDTDPGVRGVARTRLKHLLLSTETPLDQRQRQVWTIEDTELLEEVAIHAPETNLRRAALERVQRPRLLLDRCLKDPDPALRLELLGRIEDPAVLERIINAARKTDKQLARKAREKLIDSKLRQGDPDTIRQRADAILVELESYLRQRPADVVQRIEHIDSEWQRFSLAPDNDQTKRYLGLLETLRYLVDASSRSISELTETASPPDKDNDQDNKELIDPAPIVAVSTSLPVESPGLRCLIEEISTIAEVSEAELEKFRLRARKEIATADECAANNALKECFEQWFSTQKNRLKLIAVRQEQQQHELRLAIDAYGQAIEAGRLADARSARGIAHTLSSNLAERNTANQKRLQQFDKAFEKLAHWQHWSNNAQRKRLCDEIEARIGSAEHPDALLNRIKTAQLEWRKLDEAERDPATPEVVPGGLAKRFHMLCAKAIAPVRPYLAKRGELRSKKQEELSTLLDAAEKKLESEDMHFDAQALRKEILDAFHELDDVPPHERRKLSGRLRTLKELLDNKIKDKREAGLAEKQNYIHRTRRRLSQVNSSNEAVNIAKEAMSHWKTLPHTDRKTDDALWLEFRALIDPVFEKFKTEKAEATATRAAEQEEIRDIMAQLRGLAQNYIDIPHLDIQLAGLRQRWQAAANRSRDDEQIFSREVAVIENLRHKLQRAANHKSLLRVLELHRQLVAHAIPHTNDAVRHEAVIALSEQISKAAISIAERDALQAHWKTVAKDDLGLNHPDTLKLLQEMAVWAEILGNIEPSATEKPIRKQLQMQRLAMKLGNRTELHFAEEPKSFWLQWLAVGGVEKETRVEYDRRIEAALLNLLQD